jgi:tripartite-type tricarboxylate transporter receptor subunit TctC
MAPKNTPAETVIKLNASVTAIVSKQDIKASMKKNGAVPMIMAPPQFLSVEHVITAVD